MALRIVTSRLARATAQAAPGFYAGAARHMSQETDIVKDVFVEQQKKFRALLDATKDLEIPTSGDKAAIADYAQKRYDIMKKVSVRTRLRCTRTAVDGIVRARRRSDDRSPRVSFSVRASPEVEREIEPGQPGSTRPGGEGASRRMFRAPRTSTAPSRSPELAQTKTFVCTPPIKSNPSRHDPTHPRDAS